MYRHSNNPTNSRQTPHILTFHHAAQQCFHQQQQMPSYPSSSPYPCHLHSDRKAAFVHLQKKQFYCTTCALHLIKSGQNIQKIETKDLHHEYSSNEAKQKQFTMEIKLLKGEYEDTFQNLMDMLTQMHIMDLMYFNKLLEESNHDNFNQISNKYLNFNTNLKADITNQIFNFERQQGTTFIDRLQSIIQYVRKSLDVQHNQSQIQAIQHNQSQIQAIQHNQSQIQTIQHNQSEIQTKNQQKFIERPSCNKENYNQNGFSSNVKLNSMNFNQNKAPNQNHGRDRCYETPLNSKYIDSTMNLKDRPKINQPNKNKQNRKLDLNNFCSSNAQSSASNNSRCSINSINHHHEFRLFNQEQNLTTMLNKPSVSFNSKKHHQRIFSHQDEEQFSDSFGQIDQHSFEYGVDEQRKEGGLDEQRKQQCLDTPESIKSKISSNNLKVTQAMAVTMFQKINICQSINMESVQQEKYINIIEPNTINFSSTHNQVNYKEMQEQDNKQLKQRNSNSSNRSTYRYARNQDQDL